ncbi:MAG TPA: radical SAM family heme chaperone HemW [Pyrinomonadaceae bacterium]|jgi:oxygen-independent coproporphyrinogen-3 oxidase|nr:radical SAM family heme chaperone HemW [Pyrinomonadaceae bacterium]
MSRAGIYIHIPFCRTRCSYCDFATGQYESGLSERYVRALAREVSIFAAERTRAVERHDRAADSRDHENDSRSAPAPDAETPGVDTIYFGGGTPSLLAPAQVAHLMETVRANFDVSADAEVTMEMNPGTVTREAAEGFRAAGVNRASFGLQTFDDAQLRRLGRTHTAEDARRTLSTLRAAGFTNVSFDLIAGLPGQTVAQWSRNMDEALRLRPEHLSLYLLEVHEGTPLADQIRRGAHPQPDPDTAAEMYELLVERTSRAGYGHYEISNFCLPGYESRHNLKYWVGAPYYGFGNSAHSYDGGGVRWSNERDTLRYVEMIERAGGAIIETNTLTAREREAESLFLGLRLMRGVDLRKHRARFGADVRSSHAEDLARFCDAGLIEVDDDTLRLTSAGALLSNEVFAAFV